MASGGSYIAYSAARKLGFKYPDNEVLYRAAKFMGLDGKNTKHITGRQILS